MQVQYAALIFLLGTEHRGFNFLIEFILDVHIFKIEIVAFDCFIFYVLWLHLLI